LMERRKVAAGLLIKPASTKVPGVKIQEMSRPMTTCFFSRVPVVSLRFFKLKAVSVCSTFVTLYL
jgi:hypothetical protein